MVLNEKGNYNFDYFEPPKTITMKLFLLAVLCISQFTASAQTKADSTRLIRQAARLYDLEFSDSEAVMMMEGVAENNGIYKGLHATLPTNDIPFP